MKSQEDYILEEAMTVGELIDILHNYPRDKKVCTTWESTIHPLTRSNIYKGYLGALFLDADSNSYKNQYEEMGED